MSPTNNKNFSNKPIATLTLGMTLLTGCVAQDLAGKSFLDANGCLSSTASIVGLSNTAMSFNGNAKVGGSVVLLGSSQLQMGGNASVRGSVYAATSNQVSKNGNAKFGKIVEEDFTVHESEVLRFVDDLTHESPDQTLSSISSSVTLTGKGKLNYINVNGDISLAGKDLLTFKGGSQDLFVVQVHGNLSMTGNSNVQTQGEITARNLIFILPDENSTLHLAGNGKTMGTFFVTRGTAQISGKGSVQGSIFAWNSLDISGNGLSIEPAPFCPGSWLPAPTESPLPTPSGSPSPQPTETSTPTPSPSPTATSTPEPSPSPTGTANPEPSPTETATPEPSPTETATPEPSPTPSPTPVDPTCTGLDCGVLGI